MIDEERTSEEFGYNSNDLTYGSTKKVWCVCTKCKRVRLIRYSSYIKTKGRCISCAKTGIRFSDEHKNNMSIALSGVNHPNYGKHLSEKTKNKMSSAQIGNKNHNYGKTASNETKQKMSKSRRGKNNSNWNPTLTYEDRMHNRKSAEHHEWALNVKKRDNFTCQKCGICKKLVSHHLLGYAAHVNSRFDLDNGVTLCVNCHTKFHNMYGYKYFTDNDYFIWVCSNGI